MSELLSLSSLSKTWIFDLDGTLVKHNGYLIEGKDSLLEGVREFFEVLSENDQVIILTARSLKYKEITISFLNENNIKFNHIIFDLPHGERILINDTKPSGMKTAFAISSKRDEFMNVKFEVNDNL